MIKFGVNLKQNIRIFSFIAGGLIFGTLMYLNIESQVQNPPLAVRQRADLIFVNGIRNAQKSESAIQQRAILGQSLQKMKSLKGELPAGSSLRSKDQKAIRFREKQIEKMMAKGIANEYL